MLSMNDMMTPARVVPTVRGPEYHKTWNLFRPRGRVIKIDLSPKGIIFKGKANGQAIYLYYRGIYVGKIVDGIATVYAHEPENAIIRKYLDEMEKDPLALVMKHGLESSTCCVCMRTLTDEVSIKEGIGPICKKFFG